MIGALPEIVIASEAKQSSAVTDWIASSQLLLAMTACGAPRKCRN